MTSFSSPSAPVTVPVAPGALGVAAQPGEILTYLQSLTAWRDQYHDRLVALDERAKVASIPAALTNDVTLAYATWEAINTRTQEITTAWDSGRVDQVVLEKISGLIWGQLGSGSGGGLAVSFVEACTLAEAVLTSLAQRLDADQLSRPGVGDRLGPMADQAQRCRTLAKSLPLRKATVEALARRLQEIRDHALAGADVRSELDTLAPELSGLESDLNAEITGRTALDSDLAAIHTRLNAAKLAASAAIDAAMVCRIKIANPPVASVPNPAALGLPPGGPYSDWKVVRVQVDAFLAQLEVLEQGLARVSELYREPMDRRADLRGLLGGYHDKANRNGLAEDPQLSPMFQEAHDVLWTAPCDLIQAQQLVSAYQAAVVARMSTAHPNPRSNDL